LFLFWFFFVIFSKQSVLRIGSGDIRPPLFVVGNERRRRRVDQKSTEIFTNMTHTEMGVRRRGGGRGGRRRRRRRRRRRSRRRVGAGSVREGGRE
jgi:hypothetical protein